MVPAPHAISILIVEDEKLIHEVIGVMLSRKFPALALYFAENGKVGLELFKEHMPAIIVTDIQMPVMDGIEMAAAIKLIRPGIRFIVLTAYDNTGYYGKFREIGFHDFIPKPIEFDKLFAAIEKCLAEIALEENRAE